MACHGREHLLFRCCILSMTVAARWLGNLLALLSNVYVGAHIITISQFSQAVAPGVIGAARGPGIFSTLDAWT